jgi:hypothetical protein
MLLLGHQVQFRLEIGMEHTDKFGVDNCGETNSAWTIAELELKYATVGASGSVQTRNWNGTYGQIRRGQLPN